MPRNRNPKRELALKEMGFLEDPFTNSADPRFLYLSSQHGEVLERTQDLIEGMRGLAVVEGGFGVGKSTLARRLESIYRAAPDDYDVVFIPTASYTTEFSGLQDLAVYLGIPRRNGSVAQYRELQEYLVAQRSRDRLVVVIMDDAQKLSPDALEMIHNLYNFDVAGKLAQVILFGQPEISKLFSSRPATRSRVYSWFTLNPLELRDSFELIRFRCTVAGRSRTFISQKAFLRVHEVGNGIPRDIVTICSEVIDEVIYQKRIPGEGAVDEDIVEKAIGHYLEKLPKRVALFD